MALVTTYGYPDEEALPLLELPMQKFCTLAQLHYAGALGVRDIEGLSDFTSLSSKEKAQRFAEKLLKQMIP